jgi:arginine/lysine/ornithine decarboxylase
MVEGALNLTCTTSPSNLLLGSIEEIIRENFSDNGRQRLLDGIKRGREIKEELK